MSYKNILLVDDDSDDTEVFTDALNSLNTSTVCRTFQNPLTALRELKNNSELPDLIFLDYNMPRVNGLEFLQQMREDQRLEQIPVVLISTPPEELMNAWLEKNSMKVEYISKPDNYNDIKEMISRFVK